MALSVLSLGQEVVWMNVISHVLFEVKVGSKGVGRGGRI